MGDSDKIIKRLMKEGWVKKNVTGSHWTYSHPNHQKIITVPHPKKDLKKGLKRKIEKQAGW
jgi:predicted RNA binding protein YcfA (HicA-like mRNA interferase family)